MILAVPTLGPLGFFIVNSVAQPAAQGGGTFTYTRAGSFIPDQNGFLQNASGVSAGLATGADRQQHGVAGEQRQHQRHHVHDRLQAAGRDVPLHQPEHRQQHRTAAVQHQHDRRLGEATTNVALGANLPSGDPIFNANDTSAGGVHESNVLMFDSLGDTTNALFTFTKQAANAWSLA